MAELGEGELLSGDATLAHLHNIILGDANGNPGGTIERWIAQTGDETDALMTGSHLTLENMTYSYEVSLDFIDVETSEQTLLGGKIIMNRGTPSTILMRPKN